MQHRNKLQLILAIMLLTVQLHAQTDFTNTGTLYLSGGTDILYVSGNFTNQSGASLTNNGQLRLEQTVTNHQSSMTAGTGTLYLSGTGAQVLNGSSVFVTYNLVTDNSAGITLNNDLSVSGVHTYTSGLLHSSATPNYLIYETGSSHSGTTDSRHMTGWVKKRGTTGFSFPVGDHSYLRAIAISNLSASSEFAAHYDAPTQNLYNLFNPLVKVKANEYWQLNRNSGGTAQVTLNWDHAKVSMDQVFLTDIRAALYTGGYWTSQGGTGSGNTATTGSVTSNAMNSFGSITLAYTGFPIPLKLVSFTGWRSAGTSYLHWVSDNEQDVSHFEVQKSMDGTRFVNIGQVPARNSGNRELYQYHELASLTGTAFYRLKSVDNDGSFSYSRIISVAENPADAAPFLVLNPVQSAITVLAQSAPAGTYAYQLRNVAGQVLQQGTLQVQPNGGSLIRLPPGLSQGIYNLEIRKEQLRFSQQLLIRP